MLEELIYQQKENQSYKLLHFQIYQLKNLILFYPLLSVQEVVFYIQLIQLQVDQYGITLLYFSVSVQFPLKFPQSYQQCPQYTNTNIIWHPILYIFKFFKNSMELRSLLSKQKLHPRLNPQDKWKQTVEVPQNQTLKRCQSALSIRRKTNQQQMYQLESRYRVLEQNYKKVLDQTRIRTHQLNKQKEEIEKLKNQQHKDKKQVDRLRSMLGFLQKKDIACQTLTNQQRTSFHTKVDKSTISDFRQTGSLWSQKPNRTNDLRNIGISPQRSMLNESNVKSPRKTKSPTNRYKFIPSLPLQR